MAITALPDGLVERDGDGGKIVLAVMDGVGGLPDRDSGLTELEAAETPNLDRLASTGSLGMLVPVAPGVTPGSGPGHLSLFGYDPLEYQIGRGALSALGVGFALKPGDVAVRLNLATFDGAGLVLDRRASRPSDEEGLRVVDRIRAALAAPDGVELFIEHVKEHRAVLVFRGQGLSADLADTDPQDTGVPPAAVRATTPEGESMVALADDVLAQIRHAVQDLPVVNGVLARGFAMFEGYPTVHDRFGLRALAVAQYPMYRGVARLVGMEVQEVPGSDEEAVGIVERRIGDYDFVFVHFKAPDARGEDGNFEAKVAAIERIDALMPRLAALEPAVLAVTGDHSTPAAYGAHSWHAVPVLLASRWSRPTGATFGEATCRAGDLGRFEGKHLMTLALAHAGRLVKFGA
jgi:2,3-bisphosphoglycerate-independent phosphoglycerate mutase